MRSSKPKETAQGLESKEYLDLRALRAGGLTALRFAKERRWSAPGLLLKSWRVGPKILVAHFLREEGKGARGEEVKH